MFLHLGQDTITNTRDIVGIFDLDTASVSMRTREYLAAAEKAGRVIAVSGELPKSFVVCGQAARRHKNRPGGMAKPGWLYVSQLGSSTLKKRLIAQIRQAITYK